MRARFAALSLACALAAPLAALAAATGDAPPLAVLMSRQGDVRVARPGGPPLAAQFGMHLLAGDEIRTGPDGAADIMFAAGNSVHLGAGSSLTVQGTRAAAAAPAAAAGEGGGFGALQRFFKLKESRGTSTLATLRSASAPAELEPVGPAQTRVREAQPRFRWRASRPLGAVRLTVYHEGGVHWQADVAAGDELVYPADAPALAPGVRYSWTVETTDPLLFPPVRSRACFFAVLDDAERAALAGALAAPAGAELSPTALSLLKAGVLYDRGLLDEAIEATRAALAADATDPDLRSILARLYVETGRVTDAVAEYDRLLEPR